MTTYRTLAAVVAAGLVLFALPASSAPEQTPGPVELVAEEQILEVRDAVIDALWLKTDEYWHAGNTKPVVDICRMVAELDPQFVEAYSVAAWVAIQNGDDDQALQFYKQGIERNPDSYELLHELGMQYYMLHKRDPQGALPYLKRVAELPAPVPMKRTYAHALNRAGKPQEAAAQWMRILKEHPNDPIAIKELKKLRAEGKVGEER